MTEPTPPTTAAGRALLEALRNLAADLPQSLPNRSSLERLDTVALQETIYRIEAEARQQDGSALRLLRMAAPRLAVGGAATDAWLFEVRAFLKTAALPPSTPPALDPCPHCEQVVLTDGEHWVPTGGGWSCARLEPDR